MTALAPTLDGITLPEPGAYEIDPAHTDVAFVAKHLMVTKVRGRFADVAGTVHIAGDPLDSWVDVTIDAASIDSRSEDRDGHLRSPDFLDVEQYPTLRFRSSAVRHVGGDRFEVDGDLTIKDVARPVTLDLTLDGVVGDPWGGRRMAFSAATEIDRDDWGLTWNVALETGGVLVSRRVRIELEGQAVQQPQDT